MTDLPPKPAAKVPFTGSTRDEFISRIPQLRDTSPVIQALIESRMAQAKGRADIKGTDPQQLEGLYDALLDAAAHLVALEKAEGQYPWRLMSQQLLEPLLSAIAVQHSLR